MTTAQVKKTLKDTKVVFPRETVVLLRDEKPDTYGSSEILRPDAYVAPPTQGTVVAYGSDITQEQADLVKMLHMVVYRPLAAHTLDVDLGSGPIPLVVVPFKEIIMVMP